MTRWRSGAIQALRPRGVVDNVIVVGIDATQDALAGNGGGGSGRDGVPECQGTVGKCGDAAVALAQGKGVDREVWVPFELVHAQNMDRYSQKN